MDEQTEHRFRAEAEYYRNEIRNIEARWKYALEDSEKLRVELHKSQTAIEAITLILDESASGHKLAHIESIIREYKKEGKYE